MENKQGLYVIYDRLAEESGPVFEARNHAVAARMFQRTLEKVVAGERNEYKLLRVGSIDHATSEVFSESPPIEVPVGLPGVVEGEEVKNG